MLTVSNDRPTLEDTRPSHSETSVSDFEISRRVMEIRAGWSLSERVRRRPGGGVTVCGLDDVAWGRIRSGLSHPMSDPPEGS